MPDTKSIYEMKAIAQKSGSPPRGLAAKGSDGQAAPGGEEMGLIARTRARAAKALRQLPGADLVESGFQQVERSVLRELKSRLDLASGAPASAGVGEEKKITRTYVVPLAEPAPRLLSDLLSRATNQTAAQAQALFYSRLLGELVPDEARLVSAMSDGRPHPAVHIVLAPLIGAAQRVVVENLCLLGNGAKIAWPENAPWYLAHLIHLGIVESGPESRGMDNAYAALESGADARNRIAQAQEGSRFSPRFTRRTLRLSLLGKALWAAGQSETKVVAKD